MHGVNPLFFEANSGSPQVRMREEWEGGEGREEGRKRGWRRPCGDARHEPAVLRGKQRVIPGEGGEGARAGEGRGWSRGGSRAGTEGGGEREGRGGAGGRQQGRVQGRGNSPSLPGPPSIPLGSPAPFPPPLSPSYSQPLSPTPPPSSVSAQRVGAVGIGGVDSSFVSRSEFEALRSQLAAVLAASTADSQVLGGGGGSGWREQGEAVLFGGRGMGSQLAAVLALPLAVDTHVVVGGGGIREGWKGGT